MNCEEATATIPSTVERANEGANALFGTVDALFSTADSGGTGNEEGKEHFAPPDAPAAVDGLQRFPGSVKFFSL